MQVIACCNLAHTVGKRIQLVYQIFPRTHSERWTSFVPVATLREKLHRATCILQLVSQLFCQRCVVRREKNCPVKTAPFSTMNSFPFSETYIVSIFTFFFVGRGEWGNKKFEPELFTVVDKTVQQNRLFKTINFQLNIAVVRKCGPHEEKKVSDLGKIGNHDPRNSISDASPTVLQGQTGGGRVSYRCFKR